MSQNKFGIDSDEVVDVLDVKADMMLIDMLVGQAGYYRAYHMNKNQWISIFLDGAVSDEIIKNMIAESFEITSKLDLPGVFSKYSNFPPQQSYSL